MDRETAVIREGMSHTRADLDAKLSRLEARTRSLHPANVAQRYMPDYALDRAIGAALTLVGTGMAWRHFRNGRNGDDRRERVRAAYASYGRW